jgi:hypothetical protein
MHGSFLEISEEFFTPEEALERLFAALIGLWKENTATRGPGEI